jgi:iron complex transport system ATP-binding protein
MTHVSCYKNGRALLSQISARLPPGAICGLLGPNGSGKSTLLKVLAGIWPAVGSVGLGNTFLGQEDRLQWSRHIGYTPQRLTPAFDYTVYQMIAMGQYGLVQTSPTAIESALIAMDLVGFEARSVLSLSEGELQRVGLARAIARSPSLLLLDEPMAFLDYSHQRLLWQVLKNLAARGTSILLALHDAAAAKRHCHLAWLIKGGHLLASGPPGDLFIPAILQQAFGIDSFEGL